MEVAYETKTSNTEQQKIENTMKLLYSNQTDNKSSSRLLNTFEKVLDITRRGNSPSNIPMQSLPNQVNSFSTGQATSEGQNPLNMAENGSISASNRENLSNL